MDSMSDIDSWLGASGTPAASAPGANAVDSWLGADDSASATPAAAAPVTQAPAAAGVPYPKGPPALPSFMQGIGDKVAGAGQGMVHLSAWLANKLAPDSQFAKDANAAIPQVDADVAQQSANYDAARKAAGGTGFDWGRASGGGAAALAALAFAPEDAGAGLLGKVGTAATQGAIDSAASPVVVQPGQTYAGQKGLQIGVGTALGGAIPVGISGVKGLYNAATPLLNPAAYVGKGLAATMDPTTAAAVAANVRNAPAFVPNSAPTLDQIGGNVGLVQTAKALNNNPAVKNLFVDRGIANNAARWDAINSVAGTPQDLAAAVAARSAAAKPDIDSLLTNGNSVNASPVLAAIDRVANGPLGTNPAVSSGLSDLRDSITSRATQLTKNGPSWVAPDILDGIRQNANAFIAKHATNGVVGSQENVAMNPVRDMIVNAIEGANPGYKQYLANYAANSTPVNTMQVGQQIAESLANKAQDVTGAPTIMPPAFNSAFDKAMNGAEYGIDPGAQATLEGVQNDLGRATISNSIRQGGSDTAYNNAAKGWVAKQIYGPSFEGASGLTKAIAAGATAFAGHPLAAAGVFAGASRLGQFVGGRLDNQLANYFLNPSAILPYLDQRAGAAATPAARAALMRMAGQIPQPAAIGGLLSMQQQ
jgi:hypothetical protein